MVFTDLEREYVMGDLKLYREFDNSHFISNAKSAITNKVQAVNMKMKFDYYSSMLAKAISSFEAISIDKDSIGEFLTHYNSYDKIDTLNYTIKDIDHTDVTTFKPQYLTQYVDMVQTVIDKVLTDSIEETELIRYLTGELPERVERQVVKTNLRYGASSKELINAKTPIVKADGNYIKGKVIPFVYSFQITKDTTLGEARSLLDAIKKAEDMMNAMYLAVEKIKAQGNLDFAKIQKLNQISYNGLRGIIDVISFITFMMIRKMDDISEKALACERLYNDVTNFNAIESVIEESVFATDQNSLGADLMDGKAGAFDTLSQNIYDFHSGMNNDIENVDVFTIRDAESLLQNTEKDNEPVSLLAYSDVVKALLSISSGLDIIGAEGDEYLMLFDDVLEKSGLGLDLKTRYQGALEGILNLSAYNCADSDIMKYKCALTEVKSFGKNMEIIAENVNSVNKKAKMLLERFEENPIAEYRDVESSNELKIFLKGFMLNWQDFVNVIAHNFYERLKALGDYLCKSEAFEVDVPDNELSIESGTDFTKFAFDDAVREFEEEADEYFKALESSYYIERAKVLRGINVVLEADQPAQSTVTTTPETKTAQPATKADTNKVTIQDNSAETGKEVSSSGSLSKLKADIGEFLNNIITKFTKMFTNNKGKYDSAALNQRSYSNVQISIPNYNTDFQSRELKDPGTIANVINSMTPQVLQTIPDKKTLYQKLFAGTAISSIPYDEKNPDAWKTAVLNTYKFGTNNQTEASQYANNELKSFITSVALPFCDNISNQISDSLTSLGNKVDTKIKALGGGENNNGQQTNTVKESVSIFTEADANAPAPNTEGSISTKVNWLRDAVKVYSGIILNVLRDIGVDFTKILVALTPKAKKTDTGQNPQPAQQTENTTSNNG